MIRCLTLALIVLGLMLITSVLVNQFGPPAFRAILGAIGAASYITFSLSLASAYTGLRGLLVIVVAMTILSIIPSPIAVVARNLAPIGVGILLGVALRRFLPEPRERSER